MKPMRVELAQLRAVGEDLTRPECVACTPDGTVYTTNGRGGVSQISPDGTVRHILARGGPEGLLPNGIALRPDGSFLLADLGAGGVYTLSRSGQVQPFLMEAGGRPLPPTNFVLLDAQQRVWVTVSTRREPRHLGYRQDVDDGFIVLHDERGTRIVADGLGFTNECHVDPTGSYLYVNETYGRRTSRFRLGPDGSLGERETVTTYGHGTYPDGLTFDAEGSFWVTSVVSNRLIRVSPDGEQQVVLEDNDPGYVEEVERAYQSGTMGRAHMDSIRSERLRSVSSLAFGGPDLRTAYLGCLLGSQLFAFESPVAGHPPPHWNW